MNLHFPPEGFARSVKALRAFYFPRVFPGQYFHPLTLLYAVPGFD
jgi:hypothetical protein